MAAKQSIKPIPSTHSMAGAQDAAQQDRRSPDQHRIEEPVVTAADLVRGFSECRDLASRTPVYVTHHGRPTHVLLGVSEFRNFKERAGNVAEKSADEKLHALADWVDQAVIILDQDLRIGFANRVASALCRKPAGEMLDVALASALPELSGSLMEVHIRRTITGGEPNAADIPSPFVPGAWLRLQSFPMGDANVVMFRDITEDVQRHRMADVKAAIIDAMTVHGDIGYVRLSVRGAIEGIDAPFSHMLCLPMERIIGVPLTDLIITGARAAFRQALERAMRDASQQCLHSVLLNNRGEAVPVKASIAPLQGAYGMEGAVILFTALDARSDVNMPEAAE